MMNFNAEVSSLFINFASERDLDLDDATWPEEALEEYNKRYNELLDRYISELKAKESAKADEEYEEDFYMIDMIITTDDGPEYETIDIRKVSLERLSQICNMFPQYNSYYFKKIKESL